MLCKWKSPLIKFQILTHLKQITWPILLQLSPINLFIANIKRQMIQIR